MPLLTIKNPKGLEEETMTKIIKAQDKGQSATKNVAKNPQKPNKRCFKQSKVKSYF